MRWLLWLSRWWPPRPPLGQMSMRWLTDRCYREGKEDK
jgi:hypothetical protein